MDDRLAGRRILVVEDEALVAWLLEDLLTELGCIVVGPAPSVAQALELIRTQAPIDAAVLDVNLTREFSYPIADVLAAAGVPFLFSTGYHSSSLRIDHRLRVMLQKPFTQSDLTNALLAALD